MTPPSIPLPDQSKSQVSVSRVRQAMQARFNAISGLTPALLAMQLEEYRLGGMRIGKLWDAIEERWPILKSVAAKRKKSVARLPWDILVREDLADDQHEMAEKQRLVLKGFYNRVRATTVLNQNERGGLKLLLRQMANAIGQRHSVHEIVWRPRPNGELEAEFRHCPLWFFENRIGQLRYLTHDGAIEGVTMDPRQWLVSSGDGVMEACSVAYMYRDLPIKDWLSFCEKYGIPFIHGTTTATYGSDEWNQAETAIGNIGSDGAILTAPGVTVTPLQVSTSGEVAYKGLIDLHDRYATILWRGGDLSTQSADQSVGASLQGDESETLMADDADSLSETLQEQVDRVVLEYTFGPDVEPLAYFSLRTPQKRSIELDLRVDEFLVKHGVRLSVADAMERYGRTPAPDDAEVLRVSSGGGAGPQQILSDMEGASEVLDVLANESSPRLIQEALREVAEALSAELAPLRVRLEQIAAEPDSAVQRKMIEQLRKDLPGMLPKGQGGRVQLAFSRLLGAGVVGGLS